jgi:hypothetical protein
LDIKIFIATHKPCPLNDVDGYVPIHVGADGKADITYEQCGITTKQGTILRDDSGDNISKKNPFYCELTATYYIWKNVTADVVGLCHYRRYFSKKKSILTLPQITELMDTADIIVPKPNRYYIESLYSHYAHTFDGHHLDVTKEVVEKLFPDDVKYLDGAFKSTSGSMYNMCIMKKKYFDDYANWLFTILQGVEEKIDISGMSDFEARLFGRISEILLNAWILKMKDQGARISYATATYTEKINWFKKGLWFLAAKFLGKKYTKSA